MKVGIDLGTTYSVVARYNPATSSADIIPNGEGKDLTPSVICFMDGDVLIGDDAKRMQMGGAGEIASTFKRGIGNPNFFIDCNSEHYSAEDLSAIMYRHLAESAEESAGEKIDGAIITVPAYFNDIQRKATISAAQTAGIKVLKIMNEPTAAAIYYGYRHSADKTLMVYDLGGGTFDVTIVKVTEGRIDVLGTAGNHILGGKDWDEVLMNMVCDRFADEFGADPRNDTVAREEILAQCESFKKLLSTSGVIRIPVSFAGNDGEYSVTREEYEAKTAYLITATDAVVDSVLDDLHLAPAAVDEVLLVGGSTRMPQVEHHLRRQGFTNIKSHRDTDLAVAKGAALSAELFSGSATGLRDIVVNDVTSHSLGMLSIGPDHRSYVNEIMIERNSPVPVSKTKAYRIEEDNLTDIIEVFILQGESTVPADCTVIGKEVITGFENNGRGLNISITFSYDENGVVHVSARNGNQDLSIITESLPSDMGWMAKTPSERKTNDRVAKNIAICVDLSRSMGENLEGVKDAIRNFVLSLAGDFTKFALIGFGDRTHVISPLSSDPDDIRNAVERLKLNRMGRGTDANPVDTIREILSGEKGARVGVILTDGIWGSRDEAVESARECRAEKINLVAVGFGDADYSFLKQIATIEENAMYTTLSNLGKTVSTIATAIRDTPDGLMERFR